MRLAGEGTGSPGDDCGLRIAGGNAVWPDAPSPSPCLIQRGCERLPCALCHARCWVDPNGKARCPPFRIFSSMAGFLNLGSVNNLGGTILGCGGRGGLSCALRGCLAAPLASTHEMPVAASYPAVANRNVSRHYQTSPKRQSCPWSRTTDLVDNTKEAGRENLKESLRGSV